MSRRGWAPRHVVVDGCSYELDVDGTLYVTRLGTRRRVKDPAILSAVLRQINRERAEREGKPRPVPPHRSGGSGTPAISPESEVRS